MKYNLVISKLEAAKERTWWNSHVDKAGNQSRRIVEPYKLNTTRKSFLLGKAGDSAVQTETNHES